MLRWGTRRNLTAFIERNKFDGRQVVLFGTSGDDKGTQIRVLEERLKPMGTWPGFLIGWFTLIVFGYLSLHFFRTPILRIDQMISRRFWITFAIGLAAVVVAGPLAVLLAMTGVGILVIYPLLIAYVIAAFLGSP